MTMQRDWFIEAAGAVTRHTGVGAMGIGAFLLLAIASPVAAQDADGDGITDVRDRCPGTPTGTAVDRAGCDAFCEVATVGEGEFFRNRLIEVGGGGAAGAFGTSDSPPAGWHPRADSGSGLGFVADPLRTGWTDYHGDFFLPGTPEEAWGLTVDGAHYMNSARMGLASIPGDFVSASTECVPNICGLRSGARVVWRGRVGDLEIEQRYSIVSEGLFILMEVTVTNTGASAHDVTYLRNVDPDNMVMLSGSYATTNTIVEQVAGTGRAVVTAATAAPYASYLALGSADPDARVSFGGFSERNPLAVWECGLDSNGSPYRCAVGDEEFSDIGVQLAVRKMVPARGSAHFALVYTLNPPAITEAIGCTIPSLCGDGVLEGVEACDDGNTRSGDGCSSTCGVELGWSCTEASPSVCRSICLADAECNDARECTSDRCIGGDCVNTPLALGTACSSGICNGAATAICGECFADTHCSGARPVCDTTTNRCVGCVDSADCAAPTAVCDTTAQVCVGCLADGDCGGDTPFCDVTMRICRGDCTTAADCNDGIECTTDSCAAGRCGHASSAAGTACSTGVCDGDVTAPTCVGCLTDANCTAPTPLCAVARTLCVECLADTDCGVGSRCRNDACEPLSGPDGGVTVDAGVFVDGGGAGVDSGGFDGGGAGADGGGAGADAGLGNIDGGPGGISGGACGCSTPGSTGGRGVHALWLAALGLVLVARRRTRR